MKHWGLTLVFIAAPALSLVQEPDHCLKAKQICLVKTQKKSETVHWGEALIFLAADSLIELQDGKLRILRGDVVVQAKKTMSVESAFIKGELQGDAWFQVDEKQSLVRHLAGTISLPMAPGFENWYSRADRGVLRPVDPVSTLADWVRKFRIPSKLVAGQWQAWTSNWKGNVELSSQFYKSSIERHLASVARQRNEISRIDQQRAGQNAELRSLFRRKNGLEAFKSPSEGPNSQAD